jgi:hypothetical protein
MEKSDKFTWEFGQPIHIEDKKEIPGIRPEFSGECLDEQLDRILGNTTTQDYLDQLPSEISFGNSVAKLEISKGYPGSIVWHVRYYVYESLNPKRLNFTRHTVLYENAPDLRLALHWMLAEINRNYKDKIITRDTEQPEKRSYKNLSISELLDLLPERIQYLPTETMKLRISKGYSGKIWYAGYYTYIDAPARDFQKTYIEKVTETSLREALEKLLQKIEKYIIKEDESNG